MEAHGGGGDADQLGDHRVGLARGGPFQALDLAARQPPCAGRRQFAVGVVIGADEAQGGGVQPRRPDVEQGGHVPAILGAGPDHRADHPAGQIGRRNDRAGHPVLSRRAFGFDRRQAFAGAPGAEAILREIEGLGHEPRRQDKGRFQRETPVLPILQTGVQPLEHRFGIGAAFAVDHGIGTGQVSADGDEGQADLAAEVGDFGGVAIRHAERLQARLFHLLLRPALA